MWAQELQNPPREGSPEQLLRVHNDGMVHMQNTAFQVLQQGQELAQVNGPRPVMYLLGDCDVMGGRGREVESLGTVEEGLWVIGGPR